MYRLGNGTLFNAWPNPGGGDCGPHTITDLCRIKSGVYPGTARVERQQLASIRKLRRDVASLGRAQTHPTVEYGQFTDDFDFGTVRAQERPIQELMSNPLLLILKRETWVKVAEREGGFWDGKHMEAAAVVSGLENFRLVKATEEGELVPCYGANDLQPDIPMAIWHPCGHFEAVFKVVPKPAAKEPVATKKPTAAKKPVAAKEPAAAKQPAVLKGPVAAKRPVAAKEEPATDKEPAAPEEPAALEEPTAAKKEPAAAKEPVAVKEGGDGWVLVGKNGRPTAGHGEGGGMVYGAERSNAIGKVCPNRKLFSVGRQD